jgi:nanoRNase/pAp phosphatase (c-di-AMP/oligoRNAs hydrolase)
LRAAKIKPSTKLATALYCAIKTDTGNFERQTLIEDLNAFQFVFRYSNIAMARRIESVELPLESICYFINALSTMQIRKGRAFVHLGPVDHPDIAVQIADFSMHIETVTWSIVSAVSEGRLVIIFRNDGIRKNAGRLAKHLFDRLGSAGGHKSAARAEIPMAALDEAVTQNQRKLARWVTWQIEHPAVRGRL